MGQADASVDQGGEFQEHPAPVPPHGSGGHHVTEENDDFHSIADIRLIGKEARRGGMVAKLTLLGLVATLCTLVGWNCSQERREGREAVQRVDRILKRVLDAAKVKDALRETLQFLHNNEEALLKRGGPVGIIGGSRPGKIRLPDEFKADEPVRPVNENIVPPKNEPEVLPLAKKVVAEHDAAGKREVPKPDNKDLADELVDLTVKSKAYQAKGEVPQAAANALLDVLNDALNDIDQEAILLAPLGLEQAPKDTKEYLQKIERCIALALAGDMEQSVKALIMLELLQKLAPQGPQQDDGMLANQLGLVVRRLESVIVGEPAAKMAR